MNGASVLIAAVSGRALAQAARRAGFVPLVVDAYGDRDTLVAAAAHRRVPAGAEHGFSRRGLIAALEALAAQAPSPPVGLVLGTGFEARPELVAELAGRFRIAGCGAEAVRSAKDPAFFFPMLDKLGIRHPSTMHAAPTSGGGWLSKQVGGSGGWHIRPLREGAAPRSGAYAQARVKGEPLSVLAVVDPQSAAVGFTRQWTSPAPRRAFRYGGAVGPVTPDEDLEARLVDMSVAVARALGLAGLVSLDFLIDEGEPILIEVNPRPGATLDVLDDAEGSLFKAHVAAGLGEAAVAELSRSWRPPAARAVGYAYADDGAVTASDQPWPVWSADLPQPGTRIPRYQPALTVTAEAADLAAAEVLCQRRLGLVRDMLYDTAKIDTAKTMRERSR